MCPALSYDLSTNHVTFIGGVPITYDAAGNQSNDQFFAYQWDSEGRLATVVQGGSTYQTNTYNSLGQLVESDYPGFNAKVLGAFDASGRELGPYNGVGAYWWDQDVWAGGRMLAQEYTGVTYFLHANAIGSDTQVTNGAGTVLMDMLYYPWAQVWQTAGSTVDSHFAGFQQSAGPIYQTPNRSYLDSVGRWLVPDPGGIKVVKLDDPQTWNMYAYALNNPTTLNDPSGLNACGAMNDSGMCEVTITFASRTKDKNGKYNDQFVKVKNSGQYNATATVTVNGKEVATFLARTTPSDAGKYATILNGTYSGELTTHDGHPAIRLNGRIPVISGLDPFTDKSFATGIDVHAAGIHPMNYALNYGGRHNDARGISEGCQLVCTSQYNEFLRAVGVEGQQGPPQQHFTVNVNTRENQDFPVGMTDLLGIY